MSEFAERRAHQLGLEELPTPEDLAERFAAMDRRQLEGSVWRLGIALAGCVRAWGGRGRLAIPINDVLDAGNDGKIIELDVDPAREFLLVSVRDGEA